MGILAMLILKDMWKRRGQLLCGKADPTDEKEEVKKTLHGLSCHVFNVCSLINGCMRMQY